jgi:hypothetical protein
LIVPITSEDVAETQGSCQGRTDEVSEDVMEGGFFHADCCGWSLFKWLATTWLFLLMYFVFWILIFENTGYLYLQVLFECQHLQGYIFSGHCDYPITSMI